MMYRPTAGGRLRSIHLSVFVNIVHPQVHQNQLCEQKYTAYEMNISVWLLSCILCNDLCLDAYWHCMSCLLNASLLKQLRVGCKKTAEVIFKKLKKNFKNYASMDIK